MVAQDLKHKAVEQLDFVLSFRTVWSEPPYIDDAKVVHQHEEVDQDARNHSTCKRKHYKGESESQLTENTKDSVHLFNLNAQIKRSVPSTIQTQVQPVSVFSQGSLDCKWNGNIH